MIKRWAIGLTLSITMLHAQAKGGRLRDAAAILDRYVEVTGGAAAFLRYFVDITETTVTEANGKSYGVTIFRSRDGQRRTEIESGTSSKQSGVYNGNVWEFSEGKGARVTSGKPAARELALSRGFTPETWRKEFSGAVIEGEETVSKRKCYRVMLTRTDGSKLRRFFDEQSGLLVREVSSDFDEAGIEHGSDARCRRVQKLGICARSVIYACQK